MRDGEVLDVKVFKAKRKTGKKKYKTKLYEYDYYAVQTSIYIGKKVIDKYGDVIIMVRDKEEGVALFVPLEKVKKGLDEEYVMKLARAAEEKAREWKGELDEG